MAYVSTPKTLTDSLQLIANCPQHFSTVNGSIQGTVDGFNAHFTTGVVLSRARVYRNGLMQTLQVDCNFFGQTLVFLPASIPQPGDRIEIMGSANS